MTEAQTVRGAVASREDQAAELETVETRVRAAHSWFTKVCPDHVNPDRFTALCIGALRNDPDLMEAATLNPAPFMQAAAQCAAMGLVPGETYHFVGFVNSKTGLADITGMVDYKGEIEMIYRSGGVQAVHCQVVRAKDEFAWRPGMTLPHHVIPENAYAQPGLADDGDRGPLTGAYAYATLTGGGLSDVIVMAKSEVMKHKAVAKSGKFWNGPWEPDMWLKTVLHKLYDRVPHSREYMAARVAASTGEPIPGGTGAPALPGPSEIIPAKALTSPDQAPDPDAPEGVALETPAQWVKRQFEQMGRGTRSKAHSEFRTKVAAILAAEGTVPLDLKSTGDLDPAQVNRMAARLRQFLGSCEDDKRDPAQALEELVARVGETAGVS